MLKLTASERQTLAGPSVIGGVLGMLVGLASYGFDGEYAHLDQWHMALDALGAFAAAFVVAAVPLGVLPIAIQRFRRRHESGADDEG